MSQLFNQIRYQGARHEVNATAVSLTNIYASYKDGRSTSERWVLRDVSFDIEAGDHCAVIGPNGAGKSTLFKLLGGLLPPDKGSVKLFGQAPDRHICVAYVPQRSSIDWTFPVTVEDVVMMGRTRQIGLFRRPSRIDKEIVQHSLERVDALDLASAQIGGLSGGQQQRVFIARALAMDATLLLMDEPLAGLDIPAQEKIFKILAGLRSTNVTVMVATHDLQVAQAHFDRVMLLNRQVVAFGEGTAVLTTENLLTLYGGSSQPSQFDHLLVTS